MNPLLLFLGIAGSAAAVAGGIYVYETTRQQNAEAPAAVEQSLEQAAPVENKPDTQNSGIATLAPEKAPETPAENKPEEVKPEEVKPVEVTEEVKPEEKIEPSFDVVRVDPSGDTLIAGKAEPNSSVTIKNNDEIVAEVQTDASGSFVLLPEKPLEGVSNSLSLESKQGDDETVISKQTVVVSVPEKADEEVLVVVVEEGNAAKVLQKPKAVVEVEAPKPTVEKEQVAEVNPVTPEPEVNEPEAKEIIVAEVEPEVEVTEELKAVARLLPTEEAPIVKDVQDEKPEATEKLTEAEPLEPEAQKTVAKPAAEPVAETKQTEIEVAKTEEPAVQSVVEVEKPQVAPEKTKATPVVIEAVEVEGDRFFVAGSAEAGKEVRAYVDGKFLASAKTDGNGRLLFEETKQLPEGTYRIRIDQVDTNGNVEARSEVRFAVDKVAPKELAEIRSNQNVIIRRSDNLWTISRRLYGQGVRFSAIYQANKDQIKDPDMIFPGQIFQLPEDGLSPAEGPRLPKDRS